MNKIALTFVLTLMCLFGFNLEAHATPCTGGAVCAQVFDGSGTSSGTPFTQIITNVHNGTMLLDVQYFGSSGAVLPTVMDSNNLWYLIACDNAQTVSGVTIQDCYYYSFGIVAGANTVSISLSQSGYSVTYKLSEYDNVYVGNSLDVFNVFSTTAGWGGGIGFPEPAIGDGGDVFVLFGGNDFGTNGTFTNGSTIGTFPTVSINSSSGFSQLAQWDYQGIFPNQPSRIPYSVNNTGGTNYRSQHVAMIRLWTITPNTNCGIVGVSCTLACSGYASPMGGTTLGCDTPITQTGGEMLVAGLQTQLISASPAPTITGCGFDKVIPANSWLAISTGSGSVWTLPDAPAGTCTPIVTVSQNGGAAILNVWKITPLPKYSITSHVYGFWNSQLTFPGGTVNNIPAPEPNSISIVIAGAASSVNQFPSGCPTNALGSSPIVYTDWHSIWTTVGEIAGYNRCLGLGMFTQPNSTGGGGVYNSVNYGGLWIDGELFYLSIRTQPTAAGDYQQGAQVSTQATGGTATTALNINLQDTETMGDDVLLAMFRGSGGIVLSDLTNTAGWPCHVAVPRYSAAFGNLFVHCTVTSVGSNPNVFTLAAGSPTQMDIMMAENSSAGFNWDGSSNMLSNTSATPITTPTVGPTFIYQVGSFYSPLVMAFSNCIGSGANGMGVQVEPQAPYRLRMFPQYYNGVNGVCMYADAHITNVGGTLAQSAVVNTPTATVDSLTMWARGQAVYNFPVMDANDSSRAGGGTLAQSVVNPAANGIIVVCAEASGGPFSFTYGSPPVALTNELGCGPTDNSCMAVAFGVPSGTIPVNGTGGTGLFMTSAIYHGFNGVDSAAKAYTQNTGSSAGPIAVTTSAPNELGIGCSGGSGSPTGANNLITGNPGTNSSQKVPGTSDGSALSFYNIDGIVQQNYGITCNTDSTVSTTTCALLFFGFTPVSVGSQLTIINVNH